MKIVAMGIGMIVVTIAANLLLLGAAVWLVVKILQCMGVL
jgi:hypothetical protein